MQPNGTSEEWRRELTELREEVRQMAAELEAKVPFASLDVRYRWSRLESRIDDFEERSRTPTRPRAAQLTQTARQLRDRLRKLSSDMWM